MFFVIEKSEETTFEFSRNAVTIVWFSLINAIYKMETQKFIDLLNESDNESSKFATRDWYVINGQNMKNYGEWNGNDESIKFETKVNKASLCGNFDTYVTGDIIIMSIVPNLWKKQP